MPRSVRVGRGTPWSGPSSAVVTRIDYGTGDTKIVLLTHAGEVLSPSGLSIGF